MSKAGATTMLKHKLVGTSGLRSSEIALGTMPFGDKRAWGCPEDAARAILECFVKAGGTTIDTAPNYGDGASEEIVGAFACGSALERAPPTSRSIILNCRKKLVLTGVPIGADRDPGMRQYKDRNQCITSRQSGSHSNAASHPGRRQPSLRACPSARPQ